MATNGRLFDPCSPINWANPMTRGLLNFWLGGPNPGWWGMKRMLSVVGGGRKPTHGTFTNSPTWGRSYVGFKSVDFVGSSSTYVSVAGGGGLNNLQTGSIISQCRWSGTQDAGFGGIAGCICGRQKDASFSNQLISLNGTNPATAVIRWHAYSSAVNITGATSPGDGTWRTVGISYASGNHKLYLDGKQDGTQGGTGTISNDANIVLSIGGWIGGGAAYMNGQIAVFAVFNRFLSAQEQNAWHQEINAGMPNVINWIRPASIRIPGGAITKALTGSLSMSGAITKKDKKPVSGTLSISGAIAKKAKKPVSGAISLGAAIAKKAKKPVAGTLSLAGAIANKAKKPLAGSISMSATLLRKAKKAFAESLALAGTLAKKIKKALSAVLTLSGSNVVAPKPSLWMDPIDFKYKIETDVNFRYAINASIDFRYTEQQTIDMAYTKQATIDFRYSINDDVQFKDR